MADEQSVTNLRETEGRVEMLIRYFTEDAKPEPALLAHLEQRLRGVRLALRKEASAG